MTPATFRLDSSILVSDERTAAASITIARFTTLLCRSLNPLRLGFHHCIRLSSLAELESPDCIHRQHGKATSDFMSTDSYHHPSLQLVGDAVKSLLRPLAPATLRSDSLETFRIARSTAFDPARA